MGTANNYKDTAIGASFIGKECQSCQKKFTEIDTCENNNWDLQFDTSNDVNLVENEKKGYGYNLTIWIRNIYHENCGEAEIENRKEEVKKTGIHGEAIDAVMNSLESFQRKQVERMKNKGINIEIRDGEEKSGLGVNAKDKKS